MKVITAAIKPDWVGIYEGKRNKFQLEKISLNLNILRVTDTSMCRTIASTIATRLFAFTYSNNNEEL